MDLYNKCEVPGMNDNLTEAEWADAAFLIYTKPAPPPFKFFFPWGIFR